MISLSQTATRLRDSQSPWFMAEITKSNIKSNVCQITKKNKENGSLQDS